MAEQQQDRPDELDRRLAEHYAAAFGIGYEEALELVCDPAGWGGWQSGGCADPGPSR